MPWSLLALVCANLVPLFGVLWLGWDTAAIVLLYWAENVMVGFYNILKIVLVRGEAPSSHLGKLLAVPFFCLHFGGFCAVHGVFLLAFFKPGDGLTAVFPANPWPAHLVFLQLLFGVLIVLWRQHPPGLVWPVLGLLLSHGISFVQNYLGKKEYLDLTISVLMGQPYKRIMVMHVAVLAGGILIMALHSPLPLLLVLVGLKVFLDIHLHLKERRQRQSVSEAGGSAFPG